MLNLAPFQIAEGRYSLVVILSEESIRRIRAYDPAEVVTDMIPEPWKSMTLKDVIITFASAKDEKIIAPMFRQGRVREALRYLSRGFKFRPEEGDGDDEYTAVQ